MKKGLVIFIISFIGLFGLNQTAQASHVAGVDITYTCLGNDSFLISVNIFRDCSGIGWSVPSITINVSSPCSSSFPVTLQTTNPQSGSSVQGINISQLCPTAVSNCNNGPHPGMQLYNYQAIVVLPPCNFWTFSYAPPCCRNTSLNIFNSQGFTSYVASTMNSAADSCNSSPQISTANPNPYACVNQLICYDLGVTEPDGDSLVYSFVNAYSAATNPLNYNGGFTATQPIPGITIDPHTGKIQFVPTAAGNYVIVVQICEYERGTGILLGCITRDMQWVVNNCNNAAPAQLCQPNSIVNFSGTGAQTGPNEVEVCYGQNFSLTILVSDVFPTGSGQYLTATTNVQQVLPGSIVSIVSNATQDSLWITISWVATLGANPFNTFNVNVSDNNCPVTATNSGTYVVKVIPSTYAGLDQQICKGVQPAPLTAMGGTTFTWAALPGGSGTGSLSCNVCKSPVATPTKTTSYVVTSDLSSSCKNMDTVTVWVSENFTIDMTTDTTICFNDSSIQISAIPSINRNFTYQWSPSNFLSNDTIQSPIATPVFTKDFFVTVTSDSGCVRKDTMNIRVSPPFPPALSISTNNSLACSGISTQLNLSLGSSPTTCGVSSQPCIGPTLTSQLGTQTVTNTSTSFPAPYANQFANVRQQYLIRASELAALGIQAGKITGLSFYVQSNSGTSDYYGYTIKMGCTPDQVLNNWKLNLGTVFNGKTVTVTNGWNYHAFDNIYNWDGTSNVVVEICFANPGAATSNAVSRYTDVGFSSSLYFGSNTQYACAASFVSGPPSNFRPNMILDYCMSPDTNAYTYQWNNANFLSDSTALRPYASVSKTTVFTVTVTDTFEVCTGTANISLNVASVFAGNDTAICPLDTIQLNAKATASCPGQGSFTWFPSTGLSDPNIRNPLLYINQTTTYVVSFADACGCTVTDTITVALGQVGNIGLTRKDPDCGIDNGFYEIAVSGGFRPYSYTIDSGLTFQVADSLFDSLSIGYYQIYVKDSLGCPSNTIIDTLVNLGSPVIDSIKTKNIACFEVPTGEIEVFTTGGVLPTYYSIDSGLTYFANNLFTGLSAGVYYVVAMSADSCTGFAEKIELFQPDILETSLTTFNDTCYQLGDGYAFAKTTGGVKPYNFSWTNSASIDSINFNMFAGNYTFSVSDANGCYVDTSFTIFEPEPVLIDSVFLTNITCHGYNNGFIEFYGSGGDSLFNFSIDSGLTWSATSVFDSLSPGRYKIVIRDQSLCSIDSVVTLTEPTLVEVSTNIDSIKICVSNCVDISASATGGNGAPYLYNWSPNLGQSPSHSVCPEKNQNYAVYAYDKDNCVSEVKTIYVSLYDSLKILIPNDTFFCKGNFLQLNGLATGGDGSGFNYEWTPYFGLNNPMIKDPVANPDTTTTYTLTITDNCGSPEVSKAMQINVFPIPNINFIADVQEGCVPLTVNLSNNSTLAYNCFINYGTGNLINTCGNAVLEYSNPGAYDVTVNVTSKDGCTNQKTIQDFIVVHPNPTASFAASPQPTTVLFPEITFTDLSFGNVVSHQWNFGSYGSSTQKDPIFEFPNQDSATIPVKLEVTSNHGCVDDTIISIIIGQEYVMFVPTAFSPNGDDLNEVFMPLNTGVDVDNFKLFIFDRWGNTVFESDNKDFGWDGTHMNSGQPVPAGVYVWKLVVGDYSLEREQHEYIGNLMLIR